MKCKAYYNEIDPKAASWLKELVKQGLIADGDVDDRSIWDVTPKEIEDYTQCHFFAGIGVWSYALRQAGWDDTRPVWTGSCPCQPFSSAGKGKGFDDERHLWPAFHHLIRECRPVVIFGEQVAGKAGESWFTSLQADLEAEDYAAGLTVFPACGIGAPHQRKRLYWCAMENTSGARPRGFSGPPGEQGRDSLDRRAKSLRQEDRETGTNGSDTDGTANNMANPTSDGCKRGHKRRKRKDGQSQEGRVLESSGEGTTIKQLTTGPTNGFWGGADWLFCRDGKWRPVEPGTFPLADGFASELVSSSNLSIEDIRSTKEAKTMRLKGYGNAIVAPQAQMFIEAYLELGRE